MINSPCLAVNTYGESNGKMKTLSTNQSMYLLYNLYVSTVLVIFVAHTPSEQFVDSISQTFERPRQVGVQSSGRLYLPTTTQVPILDHREMFDLQLIT